MTKLPDYIAFKNCPGIPLTEIFIAADNTTIQLLKDMFKFNPPSRITATAVSSIISLLLLLQGYKSVSSIVGG